MKFKIGKMNFEVPDVMIDEMLLKGDGFRYLRTLDGKLHNIEKIQGHHEFDRDDVKIVQLGWLFKNRSVNYSFMDAKNEKLAMDVVL